MKIVEDGMGMKRKKINMCALCVYVCLFVCARFIIFCQLCLLFFSHKHTHTHTTHTHTHTHTYIHTHTHTHSPSHASGSTKPGSLANCIRRKSSSSLPSKVRIRSDSDFGKHRSHNASNTSVSCCAVSKTNSRTRKSRR